MEATLDLTGTGTATAASCRHCCEACGEGSVASPLGRFCCAGCEAVFVLLDTHGLGAFYTCTPTPGVSLRQRAANDAARFAVLDDPVVAARVVEFDDGTHASAAFKVPGLHCASCVWLLEHLWKIEPGIVRCEADLLRRSVQVWFRRDRVGVRQVAELLAAVGYEPALEQERSTGGVAPAVRRLYLRLGVAGFAFGNIMLFSIPRYANGGPLEDGFERLFATLNVALALPVLLYSASDYFASAWHALRVRRMTLDVPVAIGLAALFGRSVTDIVASRSEGFLDSFAGLVFFLLIGRLFQQKAFDRIDFDRTFRSFFPLSVRVEREGDSAMTPLEQVRPGHRILVRPQEVVPADAVFLDENGAVDYAFVTGESRPVDIRSGDLVYAGGRASGRTLRLEVVREVEHSRLARLWNNPAFAKVSRHWLSGVSASFGGWFTAAALLLALAGALAWWPDTSMAVQVFTSVLIIACPCALTLAAPLTLGTAMGMLGRSGLYLKHAAVALDLSRIDTIVFDKTGTLTSASGAVGVEPLGLDASEWRLVRRLAAESAHPVSRAIAKAGPASGIVEACFEIPGQGISGLVDGHEVVFGAAPFVARAIDVEVEAEAGTTVVAIDGRLRGRVRLGTPVRAGVEQAAGLLTRSHAVWLLSGDHPADAARWRPLFGDSMWFRQSPEDKLARIQARQAAGHHVLMVGDGLNDAGALAAADVGVAVSDDTACVVPACDALVGGDRLLALPAFLRYARRARQVIVLCFVVSLIYNAVGLSLALWGLLTPLMTAILMPVSSLTIMGLSSGAMRWLARELPAA